MKNLTKLFLMSFMAAGLFACSDDNEPTVTPDNNQEVLGDNIYMKFTLDMPASRSATDDKGESNSNNDPETKAGTEEENTVSTLQLIILDAQNVIKAKGASLNFGTDEQPLGAKKTYTIRFESAELIAAAHAEDPTPIKVIALCNGTNGQRIGEPFDQDATATLAEISTDKKFLMTNANDQDWNQVKLPNKTALKAYNSEDNPFYIGGINVERVAARFDFDANSVKFPIEKKASAPEEGETFVTLTHMKMFNVSDKAFTYRRVQDAQGAITFLGKETPENYVVDYYSGVNAGHAFTNDNMAITDLGEGGTWTNIAELAAAQGRDSYTKFGYGVENTFGLIQGEAGYTPESQDMNEATGIAFVGEISGATKMDCGELQAAIAAATEDLYIYDGVLYGSWDRVTRAAVKKQWGYKGWEAEEAKGNSYYGQWDNTQDISADDAKVKTFTENIALTGDYEAVMAAVNNNIEDPAALKAAAEQNHFTVISPSKIANERESKYRVYYKYFNVHNDNNDPDVAGIMNFGVVRNNIYQLRVQSIGEYGESTFVLPDTPIKELKIWFKVAVSIADWTLRVNNIDL